MKEAVRKLNEQYGFKLSENEIELIAGQAEAAEKLFQRLYEVDLSGVAPILKMDMTERK